MTRALAAGFFVVGLALAGCETNTATPVIARASLADSADQVMFGTRFNLTDKGLSRAELVADTAYFFDENTRIELRTMEVTFFTTSGARDAYLTAKRGTYQTRGGIMV